MVTTTYTKDAVRITLDRVNDGTDVGAYYAILEVGGVDGTLTLDRAENLEFVEDGGLCENRDCYLTQSQRQVVIDCRQAMVLITDGGAQVVFDVEQAMQKVADIANYQSK